MRRATGLLDRNRKMIFEGDKLYVGTRRGESLSPQVETVVRKYSKLRSLFRNENWSEWCLVNHHGERMDMQLDQELRQLVD